MDVRVTPTEGKFLSEDQDPETDLDFMQRGRAVITLTEYEALKKKLEERNEEIAIVFVEWGYFKERITKEFARRAAKTLLPIMNLEIVTPDKSLIEKIATIHEMSTEMMEAGLLVATMEGSSDLNAFVNNSNQFNIGKQLAEKACDATIANGTSKQAITVFVDTFLIKRFYANKEVTHPVPRKKANKRGALDDTIIKQLQSDPKKETMDKEIQMDQILAKIKRRADELRSLTEEIATIGGSVNPTTYLMVMEEKTEDMQQLCDHAGAIINALQRESSTQLGVMKKKIAIIEQAKLDAEEMITEAQNDYHDKIETTNENIAELKDQAEKAKISGEEKSEIINGLELKVKAHEDAIILYQQQVNDFANEKNEEIAKLEAMLVQKQENVQKEKNEHGILEEKNGKVEENRKNTIKIVKNIGLSPIKIAQSMERLTTRGTKNKNQPIKMEIEESSESEEEEPSSNFKTPNKSTSRLNITTFDTDQSMNGTKSGNEGNSSRFTATPSKFGMKTWDPNDTNFLDHLARLEMGLKQSEEKGCTLTTRQDLI